MSAMLDVVERNVQSFSLRDSREQPQNFLRNNGEKEVIHATQGYTWVSRRSGRVHY